jgi:hypothetical protein
MTQGQGRCFTEEKVERIRRLLSETDMSVPQIAARMDCSRSVIGSINKRFGIRFYNGKRSQWQSQPSANVAHIHT